MHSNSVLYKSLSLSLSLTALRTIQMHGCMEAAYRSKTNLRRRMLSNIAQQKEREKKLKLCARNKTKD